MDRKEHVHPPGASRQLVGDFARGFFCHTVSHHSLVYTFNMQDIQITISARRAGRSVKLQSTKSAHQKYTSFCSLKATKAYAQIFSRKSHPQHSYSARWRAFWLAHLLRRLRITSRSSSADHVWLFWPLAATRAISTYEWCVCFDLWFPGLSTRHYGAAAWRFQIGSSFHRRHRGAMSTSSFLLLMVLLDFICCFDAFVSIAWFFAVLASILRFAFSRGFVRRIRLEIAFNSGFFRISLGCIAIFRMLSASAISSVPLRCSFLLCLYL